MVQDRFATVRARLSEARSAKFTSWVTLGDGPLAAEFVNAKGATDVQRLVTRANQSLVPLAIVLDGEQKVKVTRNPLSKAVVRAGVWAVKRGSAGKQTDVFYKEAKRWVASAEGTWRVTSAESRPAGFRHSLDPTMILEALAAVTNVIREDDVETGDLGAITLIRAEVDLTLIGERLGEALKPRISERKAGRWIRNAPLIVWLDESDRPRRVRYAPLPPNASETLWTTIELSEFGVPVVYPAFMREAEGRT